jgi:hypothetical protein
MEARATTATAIAATASNANATEMTIASASANATTNAGAGVARRNGVRRRAGKTDGRSKRASERMQKETEMQQRQTGRTLASLNNAAQAFNDIMGTAKTEAAAPAPAVPHGPAYAQQAAAYPQPQLPMYGYPPAGVPPPPPGFPWMQQSQMPLPTGIPPHLDMAAISAAMQMHNAQNANHAAATQMHNMQNASQANQEPQKALMPPGAVAAPAGGVPRT